eukprot:g2781.t1
MEHFEIVTHSTNWNSQWHGAVPLDIPIVDYAILDRDAILFEFGPFDGPVAHIDDLLSLPFVHTNLSFIPLLHADSGVSGVHSVINSSNPSGENISISQDPIGPIDSGIANRVGARSEFLQKRGCEIVIAEERTSALADPDVQRLIDCVVFEPGVWRPPEKNIGQEFADRSKLPDMIPSPSRDHLATPAGLLINELAHSPETILDALWQILENSLELDSGKADAPSAEAILYAVRLVAAVLEYIDCIVNRENWERSRDGDAGADVEWTKKDANKEPSVGRSNGASFVRGLQVATAEAAVLLKRASVRFRRVLLHRVWPLLARWASSSKPEVRGNLKLCCRLRAHMAYAFKNHPTQLVDSEKSYAEWDFSDSTDSDERSTGEEAWAAALICSQVFLVASFSFDMEPTTHLDGIVTARSTKAERKNSLGNIASSDLGVDQLDMFDVFTRHRRSLLSWLRRNEQCCSELMEEVVRVVTQMHKQHNSSDEAPRDGMQVADDSMRSLGMARVWREMKGLGGCGRFVPDTEVESITLRQKARGEASTRLEDYEDWLRHKTSSGADTEISLQLGEFMLKQHRVECLRRSIAEIPDYVAVFGVESKGDGAQEIDSVHCAEVRHTTMRYWWRLVGRRHDIYLWKPASLSGRALPPCWPPRRLKSRFGRSFPHDVQRGTEDWIVRVMDTCCKGWRSVITGKMALFLQTTKCARNDTYALMTAIGPPPVGEGVLGTVAAVVDSEGKDDKKESDAGPVMIKELVVFRDPPALHIYEVREHGRRWYRSLRFTSDTNRVLHRTGRRFGVETANALAVLTSELPSRSSLVVTRNVTTDTGLQRFIPSRYLRGLLPAAFLDEYTFWQTCREDTQTDASLRTSLTGYLRPSRRNASKQLTQLRIALIPCGRADATGFGGAECNAVITRVPVRLRRKRLSSKVASVDLESADSIKMSMLGLGTTEVEDDEDGDGTTTSLPRLRLLNVMYAGRGSGGGVLHQLRGLMGRLDSLSYSLAWTTSTPAGVDGRGGLKRDTSGTRIGVDVVEFPRLKLSFRAKSETDPLTKKQTIRLYSEDHDGLYLSNAASRCPRLQKLLRGLPHSVVLQSARADNSFFVLLPSTARPSVVFDSVVGNGGFASPKLCLTHGDEKWMRHLDPSVRHYLYPVHGSRLFLSTPTLASALYLLLMRFIGQQYDQVFQLTKFCLKDTALSPEERQIARQLSEIQYDRHPDAIACRLQLRVVTRGSPMAEELPFAPLSSEYSAYLSVLPHVTARCRMTLREELVCARLADASTKRSSSDSALERDQAVIIKNRRMFLESVAGKSKGTGRPPSSSWTQRLVPPSVYDPVEKYDEEVDRTVANKDEVDGIIAKLSVLSYSRPKAEKLSGLEAAQGLHQWLSHGLKLRGGKHSLGFLFLYELMTDHLQLKLLPDDSAYNWGALLTRMLAPDERSRGLLMSILRCAAFNKALSTTLPKYEDTRRFKFSTVFRGQNVIQRLMEKIRAHLSTPAVAGTVRWPQPDRMIHYTCATEKSLPSFEELCREHRMLVAVRVEDTGRAVNMLREIQQSGLRLTSKTIQMFGGSPLEEIDLSQYVERRRDGEALAVPSAMPFLSCLGKHPRARGRAAASIVRRVVEDLKHYAEGANDRATPSLKRFDVKTFLDAMRDKTSDGGLRATSHWTTVARLSEALEKLHRSDKDLSDRAISAALKLARRVRVETSASATNTRPGEITEQRRKLAFLLRRWQGQESEAWIELLIQCTMSRDGV